MLFHLNYICTRHFRCQKNTKLWEEMTARFVWPRFLFKIVIYWISFNYIDAYANEHTLLLPPLYCRELCVVILLRHITMYNNTTNSVTYFPICAIFFIINFHSADTQILRGNTKKNKIELFLQWVHKPFNNIVLELIGTYKYNSINISNNSKLDLLFFFRK